MVNKEWYSHILTHAQRTRPETNIKDLFKNYRNDTGLSLSKLGLHVISSMDIEREEFRLPKIKITPHIASLTYAEESIRQALENFKRVQSGENPLNEVRRGNMY